MTEPNQHPDSGMIQRKQKSVELAKEMMDSSGPHQRALLSLLATAEHDQLELAPLVASLGRELSGNQRLRLIALANELEQGRDLIDAIESIPGLLAESDVYTLKLAREESRFSELIQQLGYRPANFELSQSGNYEIPFSKIFLLMGKVFVFATIFLFAMTRIVPEHKKMMEEFGVEPPASFFLLCESMDWFAKFWFLPVAILILAIPFNMGLFRRFFRRWNTMTWRQTVASPTSRRKRLLARMIESEVPLADCLRLASTCAGFQKDCKRFERSAELIDAGESKWRVFNRQGFLNTQESNTLAITDVPDTHAWLLRQFGDKHQSKTDFRSFSFVRTVIAAVNILLIVLVAIFAISTFMTLIAVMSAMGTGG